MAHSIRLGKLFHVRHDSKQSLLVHLIRTSTVRYDQYARICGSNLSVANESKSDLEALMNYFLSDGKPNGCRIAQGHFLVSKIGKFSSHSSKRTCLRLFRLEIQPIQTKLLVPAFNNFGYF